MPTVIIRKTKTNFISIYTHHPSLTPPSSFFLFYQYIITYNSQQVSSSIPQEAKNILQSAKTNVLDNDKLRSLSVFFGIGEASAYSLILMPTKLCQRLWQNVTFFYLNYILLTAIVFAVSLLAFLMSPKTLIILVCLALAWFAMLRVTKEDGVKVLGLTITRKEGSAIMMIISGIVGFFAFQNVFVVSIGSSVFLALVHALARDASEHQLAESNKEKPLEPEVEFK